MVHDFKKFPELRNNQLQFYYFESPHKQIFTGFNAKVDKVTDGDTIRVSVDFRDFDFPIRFLKIAAPELKEAGGLESKQWLSERILGEEVYIRVDTRKRVGKWGRLLGEVFAGGMSMNEESLRAGQSVIFEDRNANLIPSSDEVFKLKMRNF